MNSVEAYLCSTSHRNLDFYSKCKNCQYCKKTSLNDSLYCDIELITSHMCTDLIGSHNTIESLRMLKANYEEEIEALNEKIRRLKLQLPIGPKECCTSTINELTIKSDVSLNDLLNLPNVESISIYLNKKEE